MVPGMIKKKKKKKLKKSGAMYSLKLFIALAFCIIMYAPITYAVIVDNEFSSNAQALFYIFLMGFWVVFLLMTYQIRGTSGNIIGFFNIMQLCLGLTCGISMLRFSFLLGTPITFVAVGTFVGLIVYER